MIRHAWKKRQVTETDIRMAELEVERCREKLEEARQLGRKPSTLREWERRIGQAQAETERLKRMLRMQKEKDAAEIARADRWWEVAKDAVCLYSCLDSCILFGKRKHYSCYVVGEGGGHREVKPGLTELWKQRSICASAGACRMFRPDTGENLERRNEAAMREAENMYGRAGEVTGNDSEAGEGCAGAAEVC